MSSSHLTLLLEKISTVGKTNIEVALVTTTRTVVTKAHSLFVYPGGLHVEYTLSDIPFPQTGKIGIPEILNGSIPRNSSLEILPRDLNSSFGV